VFGEIAHIATKSSKILIRWADSQNKTFPASHKIESFIGIAPRFGVQKVSGLEIVQRRDFQNPCSHYSPLLL
jgi:hypothetical protein